MRRGDLQFCQPQIIAVKGFQHSILAHIQRAEVVFAAIQNAQIGQRGQVYTFFYLVPLEQQLGQFCIVLHVQRRQLVALAGQTGQICIFGNIQVRQLIVSAFENF